MGERESEKLERLLLRCHERESKKAICGTVKLSLFLFLAYGSEEEGVRVCRRGLGRVCEWESERERERERERENRVSFVEALFCCYQESIGEVSLMKSIALSCCTSWRVSGGALATS